MSADTNPDSELVVVPTPESYRDQDGQIVADSHVQEQWNARAPDCAEGTNVRYWWRVGDPIDIPLGGDAYARYVDRLDMVLIAEYGILSTAIRGESSIGGVKRAIKRAGYSLGTPPGVCDDGVEHIRQNRGENQ